MDMQWYVIYTEWGQVKIKTFGDDKFSAKRFAETEENVHVFYGFC